MHCPEFLAASLSALTRTPWSSGRRVGGLTVRSFYGGFAGAVLLASLACGGGARNPSDVAETGRGAAGTSEAATAASDRCPLTAEQVSAAVGAPVKGPDTACGFFPVDERIVPHALYVRQVAIACDGDLPAEIGYTEKLDGLGVTAYVADMADGTHVLVCRPGRPFEISVDLADDSKARIAAARLAREVLAGS